MLLEVQLACICWIANQFGDQKMLPLISGTYKKPCRYLTVSAATEKEKVSAEFGVRVGFEGHGIIHTIDRSRPCHYSWFPEI